MADLTLPSNYPALLLELKTQIQSAQTRAALRVNRELVFLYWQIGQAILQKQRAAGWGTKVFEQHSRDLKAEVPEMKGFSPRKLSYMRKFADRWPDESILQLHAAKLTRFHNCVLLDKLGDQSRCEWYAHATTQHGWSRNVLIHQVESRLIDR